MPILGYAARDGNPASSISRLCVVRKESRSPCRRAIDPIVGSMRQKLSLFDGPQDAGSRPDGAARQGASPERGATPMEVARRGHVRSRGDSRIAAEAVWPSSTRAPPVGARRGGAQPSFGDFRLLTSGSVTKTDRTPALPKKRGVPAFEAAEAPPSGIGPARSFGGTEPNRWTIFSRSLVGDLHAPNVARPSRRGSLRLRSGRVALGAGGAPPQCVARSGPQDERTCHNHRND